MGKMARLGRLAPLALIAAAEVAAASDGSGGADERSLIAQRLQEHDNDTALDLIERHLVRHPRDAVMLYNAACVECRLGATQRGADYLIRAVKAGFADLSHLRRDPDLRPLRDHPIYRAILAASGVAEATLTRRRMDEWRRRLSGSYRFETDAPRRLALVSALDDAAHAALGRSLIEHAAHVQSTLLGTSFRRGWLLVVVPEASDATRLLTKPGVAGLYNHRRRELVTADPGRAMRHEVVHALHHDHMDALGQQHPLWIQEGLALLYEAYEVDDRGLRFLPNDRAAVLSALSANGWLLPWSRLVTLDERDLSRDAFRVYPQLRSIFRFIAAEGVLGAWYDTYVAGFDDDPTGVAALEQVFGRPLAEIERRWRAWMGPRPDAEG